MGDSVWQLFNALSGVKALSDLAGAIGIHDSIFEPEMAGPAGAWAGELAYLIATSQAQRLP